MDVPQGKLRKAFPRGSLELGPKTGEKYAGRGRQGEELHFRKRIKARARGRDEPSTPGRSPRTVCFHFEDSQSSRSLPTPLALFQIQATSPRTTCSSGSRPIMRRLQSGPASEVTRSYKSRLLLLHTKPQQPATRVNGVCCFWEQTLRCRSRELPQMMTQRF